MELILNLRGWTPVDFLRLAALLTGRLEGKTQRPIDCLANHAPGFAGFLSYWLEGVMKYTGFKPAEITVPMTFNEHKRDVVLSELSAAWFFFAVETSALRLHKNMVPVSRLLESIGTQIEDEILKRVMSNIDLEAMLEGISRDVDRSALKARFKKDMHRLVKHFRRRAQQLLTMGQGIPGWCPGAASRSRGKAGGKRNELRAQDI